MTNETTEVSKALKKLHEMTDFQCSDGNWNYDPYMHGMANGMIYALSIFEDKNPQYLEAPEVYLVDKPDNDKPIAASGIRKILLKLSRMLNYYATN